MTTGSTQWKGIALSGGRYLVTDKLGEGGMGFVYRAHDRNIDAEVVIKAPRQSMLEDPEFAGRFAREIRSLVKLSHPRIVKVSDVGDWDGLPFAVMQYLPGGSLEDRLPADRAGLADPGEVAGWLSGVADALDYVHSQGYIHRDVKPGNILFDAQGHSFLSDFGVAKVMSLSGDVKSSHTSMTGAGMVLGTPEYMAPELIMGEPFDGRVDQYALAVTVYEALCGRRPFEDDSKTKVLVLHTTKAAPALSEHRPGTSGRLNQVVLKGLAKDPADRYPSCAALAAAVAAAVAERAERDDRVRVKCGACGRSLTIPPADFARLAQAGRPVPCPACKAPVVLSREGTADAGPKAQGQPTPRGGTVVMSGQAPAPAGGSGRMAGQSKRPAATVVERARPLAAATDTDGAPHNSDRDESPVPAAKRPASTWVAVVAGVGLTLIVVAFLISGMASRRDGATTTATTTTPAPDVRQPAAAAAPSPAPPPAQPVVAVAKTPAPASTSVPPAAPAALASSTPQPAPAEPVAAATPADATREMPSSEAEQGTGRQAGPRRELVSTAGPLPPGFPTPPVPESSPADEPVDPLPVDLQKVKTTKVALEKVLEAPGLYENQLIVPTKLYCLGVESIARPDGTVTVPVIESDLHLQPNNSTLVRRGKSVELGLDPKLADMLEDGGMVRRATGPAAAAPAWGEDVAIVTLKVTRPKGGGMRPWAVNIVKLEYCIGLTPQVVTVGYKRRLRITYHTMTLTPDLKSSGEGNTQEWENASRLGHITIQLKKMFDRQSRLQTQAQWNQFTQQLQSVAAQSVRSAAAAGAANETFNRRLRTVPLGQ